MQTRLITLSSFICLLSLMETEVWAADVFMLSTTRTAATIINNGATGDLPLNNAGGTTFDDQLLGGSQYLIHFNAECSVRANDDSTALGITIVLDEGDPNEQQFPHTLCTSIKPNPGESAMHHRFSVGTSDLVSVSGFHHTLHVHRRISNFNPGEQAFLDELSLVFVVK